jgi:ubiquinone/menaquinone biosynthesis C-methylase UbiE
MGIYSSHIFPRILEWSLSNEVVARERRQALAAARGRVLEIGFGTGLNLPYYPGAVTDLVALDSEQMLSKRVEERILASRMPVEQVRLDAGSGLPFEKNEFDSVVTTFTLCSIDRVREALAEIRRVLKPEGSYVFLEHGRSDQARAAMLQDLFNPVQRFIACGCNLNRRIDSLVEGAGLRIEHMDRYVMAGTSRVIGELYRGTARKND